MKTLLFLMIFGAINLIIASEQTTVRGTIPNPSNYVLIDTEGNKYNVDSLLDEGKFFAMHLISDT